MPTPKPGQIRCPTCSRSTPPAAYCTQCGSPIPVSVRARPRGLDREELEERVRGRRPDESPFRRGTAPDPSDVYQPFAPEPEDALAVRETEGSEPEPPRVDNAPPDLYESPPAAVGAGPAEEAPPVEAWGRVDAGGGEVPPYAEPPYASPYLPEDPGRRDSGALPLLGFAALAVMALAVGVILAGLFSPGGTAVASPTPTLAPTAAPTQTAAPSVAPESVAPVESSTPEPTDGPVTFPDGAMLTVQPCGTYEFKDDLSGCLVDGSVRDTGTVWVLATFKHANGNDQLSVILQSNADTLDRVDLAIGQVLPDCSDTCSGLVWIRTWKDLTPGDYHLVLRRNGGFADSADFVIQ